VREISCTRVPPWVLIEDVPLQPYRRVLSVPRVPSLMALMFLARLPMTMTGVLMTLYVVTGLGRGYGAAGLVSAGVTLGMALGAPLVGRCFDRYGLRPVVAVCGIGTTVFWLAAPHLPYEVLAAVAVPAGMLAVPSGSLARQVLSALVPAAGFWRWSIAGRRPASRSRRSALPRLGARGRRYRCWGR